MSWNYRIVKHIDKVMGESCEYYSIHEVYYHADGVAHSVSENPEWPQGDTPEELKSDFELMQKAFNKPVLNYEDF